MLLIDEIKQEQRQKILLDAQISLLPHLEDKARQAFFEMFKEEEESAEINEKITFEETKRQIEEAKKQLQNIKN